MVIGQRVVPKGSIGEKYRIASKNVGISAFESMHKRDSTGINDFGNYALDLAHQRARRLLRGRIVMDDMYLPVIVNEDDFESFKSIMHDELAPAYEEWLKRHSDRVSHYCETHKIVEVEVKPEDFSAYLHAGGHGANMNSLYAFAEIVGKRCKN